MKPEELGRKLTEAGAQRLESDIRDICKSIASFIAEIDSSSEDVAAYLHQRLGPILRHPAIRLRLDAVGKDGRKLARDTCRKCHGASAPPAYIYCDRCAGTGKTRRDRVTCARCLSRHREWRPK